MIVHTLHPLDAVLAEIGTLARRGRHGSMDETECSARIERIRQAVVHADIDQDGRIRDRLDVLARTLDDGSLTRDWFDTITKSIRDRVARARDSLTPDSSRLGESTSGRRYGGLTVFDGGRCDTPNDHQRSL